MTHPSLKHVEGYLIDLDGVIYLEETPYPGAIDTIQALKQRGLPCRFATNTTTRSRDTLYEKIVRLKLPIEREELVTPPRLAADFLRMGKKSPSEGSPRLLLVMDEDTRRDFAQFPQCDLDDDNADPDYIVIGNFKDRWDYPLLNRLFHMIIRGAGLIALHKGRYWQTEQGLTLDIGCFVTGLEYASGAQATVIGKPEPLFFRTALDDMGVEADRAAMIGDDVEFDIGGAQRVGMAGILVKTGKYREDLARRSEVHPDLVIDSIQALQDML